MLATTTDGEVRIPEIVLIGSAEGVRVVVGPTGKVVRSWSWWELTSLDTDGQESGSDGRFRQVVGLAAHDRRHRFLVPAPDLSEFLAATARWRSTAESPRAAVATTPSPARRRRSTAAPSLVLLVGSVALGKARGAGRSVATAGRMAAVTVARPVGGFLVSLGVLLRRLLTTGRPGRVTAPVRSRLEAGWRTCAEMVRGLVRWKQPRHARLLRIRPVSACVVAVSLVAGGALFGAVETGGAQAASPAGGSGPTIMSRMAREYATQVSTAELPAATTPPAPAPPSLAGSPPLRPHEVFGFAPYWTLPESSGFDVADLTTIAYFSLDVNGDGSIETSGPGWTGYQSQDLATLITQAHAAGARVVLTVTCFGQDTLDQLTSDPTAPQQLATSLIQLVSAKNMDGVNFDFEGLGDGDQAGLDSLISQVSTALRAADPHWQVTMDTYASSAGDPGGFYDIPVLAQSVDAFFVMAYDMSGSEPSPTAPLTGTGFTDLEALQEYTSVVSPSKVILGVPYYGYDWPTTGPELGAQATGDPTPLSYAQIAVSGHPVYWDAATQTAWTSYQVGSQWHQTWFDNPTSLALKAQLADKYQVAGVGIWALGMDGNDPAMLDALLGQAPVVKSPPGASTTNAALKKATTTTSTVPGPNYHFSGTWNGTSVSLTPVAAGSLPDGGADQGAGDLTGFTTDDPADACLGSAGALPVAELLGEPGVFVVTAQTPPDCAGGTWTFVPRSAGGGGSGAGGGSSGADSGGGGGPGTTTTSASTTTTTTTTSTTTTTTSPTTTTTTPTTTTTTPTTTTTTPTTTTTTTVPGG